jgi:hypothetical protein
MKPIIAAPVSLLIGYATGICYFTSAMLLHGERFGHDYWFVLIWVAYFTFSVGAALFLPAHFLIKKNRFFWSIWICGPFGAVLGFGALWLIYRELALHYVYGGQAAIIGGSTYVASRIITKNEKAQK